MKRIREMKTEGFEDKNEGMKKSERETNEEDEGNVREIVRGFFTN